MPSLFCMRCKSLTPPGSERCRVCGAPIGDVEGKQHCLTDAAFDDRREERKVILPRDRLASPYFPYEPRESQMSIVNDIAAALASSEHIVMESGTGTGKTICALAGALQHARPKQKKIIYLTRTISQSDQVMRELRSISEIKDVSGMTLTGRKKSCPMFRSMKGYEDLTPHIIANLCEERKAKSTRGEGGGCRYYDRVKP
ncbi:MAG: DEAD/DEAH box helicase family protein, partial [Methanomassiliicoccaceae archaeon]|nr:DEAD/DEAH box helicase family protein [Methanomassiliicoccaceae archaeon]